MPYQVIGDEIDAPVRVMLVTSRETRRWILPKGNQVKGLTPHAAAAREAAEEAGVLGAACPTAIGAYRYRKRLRAGASRMIDVDVFPFVVTTELDQWEEQHERERRWFSLDDAANAVDEADLRDLIRSFRASEFREPGIMSQR